MLSYRPLAYHLLLALTLLGGACSSSHAPPDASNDAPATDLATDAPDATVDAGSDAAGDASPDFPAPSEAGPDFPNTDATLSSATVLYITTTDPDSFGLREVSADGQGTPKAVAAFSGLIDFETLQLTGIRPALAFDRGQPLVDERGSYSRIRLPGGRGDLYYFRRTLTASSGIVQIGAQGSPAPKILFEIAGLYSDVIDGQIAVDAAVERAALVAKKREVHVLRLDGTTFPGAKVSRSLSVPTEVTGVAAASLTVAGSRLFAVGRKQDGADVLLEADITDAAPAQLSVVAMAQGGGVEPTYIADDPLLARQGGFLLLRAGPQPDKLDLYRVPVGGGAVVKSTAVAASIAGRGRRFGGNEGRVAISPKGERVAWVVRESGREELYLAKADGSGQVDNPTKEPVFNVGGLSAIYNLVFIDDDTLLFMGGVGPYQLDLYRYDAQTQILENVTAIGTTSPPFDGLGGFSAQAAWLEEAAGWFYFIIYDSLTGAQELWGTPLVGGALKKLTAGVQVGSAPADYTLCPTTRQLFFIARPDPAQYQSELYAADLKTGVATRITSLSGKGIWQMSDVTLSDDCARLLVTGGAFLHSSRLHEMKTSNPASLRPITAIPRTHGERLFTPDGSTVVYASGGSFDAMTLKAVLAVGSVETVLDSKGGTVEILAVY
ncbi:MAG: hypothetical protein CSA65_09500 [Proteobacteria bacterium]|nr:MAG: hypothetical protein CSA65_09500 [Pseudomonadota bacterium]